MAVKSAWQKKYEELDASFAKYKDSIPVVLHDCIEAYELEGQLCEDGLDDFCNRLGVVWAPPVVDSTITINVTGLEFPTQMSFGEREINDDICDDIQGQIKRAIENAVSEYATACLWIDMNFEKA